MDLIISIIGFGNVGKTIGGLLLPMEEQSIHLNIIDTDLGVEGAILDLQHGAELYPKHQISHNNQELLNESDFVFHCAGASVPKGMSRLVTSRASIDITKAIFKEFKPTKEPFVIVVANPVEIIAYITQKETGLPKQNIIGTGTYLDSIRMNYVVKEHADNISSINAILLGEHGSSAFLSEQLSTLNGQPFNSMFDQGTLDSLMTQVKASAGKIKETQEATIFGVSYCAIRIFEALLSDEPKQIPVSTFIPDHLTAKLDESDIYLSLPSEVSDKGAIPTENYQPNSNEQERLKECIKVIRSYIPE